MTDTDGPAADADDERRTGADEARRDPSASRRRGPPTRHDPRPPDDGSGGDDGSTTRRGRHRWGRIAVVVLAVVVGFLLAALAAWLLRLPSAEPDALAAVLEDPELVVTRTDDVVALAPATGDVDTTVVFYPGASVPPEAYLATWAEVVRDRDVVVRIPRMPLRLAVLDRDGADGVRAAAVDAGEDTENWWIGGHSLGGAMAAAHLADESPGEWDGLVLWAAYPSGDALVERDDLVVVSVSGTEDGRTTPEDVDASRANLPADTTFAVLDGVTHAQFGAYGGQRGDGTATVNDDVARRSIADATAAALAEG